MSNLLIKCPSLPRLSESCVFSLSIRMQCRLDIYIPIYVDVLCKNIHPADSMERFLSRVPEVRDVNQHPDDPN